MATQYIGTTISGLSTDDPVRPTLTANEKGVLFVETDTNKVYQWDGDSWNEITSTAANLSGTTLNSNIVTSSLTTVGALNAGSITSGFTSIDVGSGAITTTGTITAGNLNVTGTTTTVNSTNTTISDKIIELASGASTGADAGIIIERGSSGHNAIMAWDEDNDRFHFGTTTDTGTASSLTITTGTLEANLVGNVTGNTSGNAGTVTNGVYTTGAQTIAGSKTLTDQLIIKGDQSALRHQTANGTDRFLTGLRSDLDANDFVFHTYGGDWNFRNGKVGIGISPTYLTHIYGAEAGEGTALGQLAIQSSTAYGSTPDAGIIFLNQHTSGSQAIMGGIKVTKTTTGDGNYSGTMTFQVRNHGAVAYDAMTILNTGNVGIGDDAPETLLHLKDGAPDITYEDTDGGDKYIVGNNGGNFRIRNATDSRTDLNITGAGNVGIGETSSANLLHVKVDDTGVNPHASAQIVLERAGTNYLQFLTAANGTSGLLFGDANDNDVSKIYYDHNTTTMYFQTEAATAATIDSTQTLHTNMFGIRSGDHMYLRTDGNGTKANIRLSDSDSEVQFNNASNAGILSFGTHINSTLNKNLSMRTKYVSSQYKVQVGLNIDDPFQNVAGGTVDLDVSGLHIKDTVAHGQLLIEANPPSLHVMDSGGASNDKWMMYRIDGGLGWFQSLNDDGSDRVDNILVMDMGTGHAGFNAVPKQDWNSSFQAIHLGNQTAFANFTSRGGYWLNNVRYNGSSQFTYINNDEACVIDLVDGCFRFRTAGVGSADAAASLAAKFYIANNGQTVIGSSTVKGNAKLSMYGGIWVDPQTWQLAGSGNDSTAEVAMVLDGYGGIYSWFDGYNRNIIKSVATGIIEIGQGNTGIWNTIDLHPGNAGKVRIYGDDPSSSNEMLIATFEDANLTLAGQIKISGGSPGADKVLTSDANGLATWEEASGGGGGTMQLTVASGHTITPGMVVGINSSGQAVEYTTTGADYTGLKLYSYPADQETYTYRYPKVLYDTETDIHILIAVKCLASTNEPLTDGSANQGMFAIPFTIDANDNYTFGTEMRITSDCPVYGHNYHAAMLETRQQAVVIVNYATAGSNWTANQGKKGWLLKTKATSPTTVVASTEFTIVTHTADSYSPYYGDGSSGSDHRGVVSYGGSSYYAKARVLDFGTAWNETQGGANNVTVGSEYNMINSAAYYPKPVAWAHQDKTGNSGTQFFMGTYSHIHGFDIGSSGTTINTITTGNWQPYYPHPQDLVWAGINGEVHMTGGYSSSYQYEMRITISASDNTTTQDNTNLNQSINGGSSGGGTSAVIQVYAGESDSFLHIYHKNQNGTWYGFPGDDGFHDASWNVKRITVDSQNRYTPAHFPTVPDLRLNPWVAGHGLGNNIGQIGACHNADRNRVVVAAETYTYGADGADQRPTRNRTNTRKITIGLYMLKVASGETDRLNDFGTANGIFVGLGADASNVTAGNTATVTVTGGVNERLSGLTAGREYYIDEFGSIFKNGPPQQSQDLIRLGTAVSSTKLLVMGDTPTHRAYG